MHLYIHILCVCVCLRRGSVCKHVYVWESEKCLFWAVYCILTCVGDSDIAIILDKYHGLCSNPLLPHGISVSDGGFAFTQLTGSEVQYQTGLRPLVCSQLEFTAPFTLVMHQSHIWKKREKKNIFTVGFLIFPWICALKNIYIFDKFRFECDAMKTPFTELALLVVCTVHKQT